MSETATFMNRPDVKLRRPLCAALAALGLLLAAPGALRAAPAKAGSGRVAVATQPAGATIFLDGQASGKTPGEIDGLAPGRYFLRLELEGYRPAELVVELSPSQSYQSATVELLSNSAPPRPETATKPAPAAAARPTPPPVAATQPLPSTPPPATPAPREIPPPVEAPPAPAPASDADEVIQQLVAAHLKSIADGDIDAYLRLCAPRVDLYDEGIQSQDTIRKSRQKLKERWPNYEITNVRGLSVRATDKPDTRRAAVSYDWNVRNPKTGKTASGTASDLLDFKQTGEQWLIVKARQNVDRKRGR